jgi:hypothetical protein
VSRMSAGKGREAGFLIAVSMTIAPFDRSRGKPDPGGVTVASSACAAGQRLAGRRIPKTHILPYIPHKSGN